MKKHTLKNLLVAIAGLTFTAACVPAHGSYTGASVMKRNDVQNVRYTHDFSLPKEGQPLGEETQDRLYAFLNIIDFRYGDIVSLDTGNSTEGFDPIPVTTFLKANGIRLASRAPIIGALPENGKARLIVERYIATAPDCNAWSGQQGANFMNAPSSDFGCASQALLGMMVADKRDLILPNKDTGPTGDRAIGSVILSRITTTSNEPAIGVSFSGSGLDGLFGSRN